MKIGLNTYEQRPQFKASFAKNPQTKQALKTLLEEDFYKLYEIKEALKAGAKPVYGIKMLLYQGAESFRIWTGRDAPVDAMEKALKDTLNLE